MLYRFTFAAGLLVLVASMLAGLASAWHTRGRLPGVAESRYALGIHWRDQQQPQRLIRELDGLTRLNPLDYEARYELARGHGAAGDVQAQVAQLEALAADLAARHQPPRQIAIVHNDLGGVLAAQGRLTEARRHFALACQHDPQPDAPWHANLAGVERDLAARGGAQE